jgi:hypothetical protein
VRAQPAHTGGTGIGLPPRVLCDNVGVNVADLRGVQARLGGLHRDELAAASFAVVDVLRPFAELGGAETAYPLEIARLLDMAVVAMRSQSVGSSRAHLAEVEAIPVVAASEEPAG